MSATKSPTRKEIDQIRSTVRRYAEANRQPITVVDTTESKTRAARIKKLDRETTHQNIDANEQTIQALVEMVTKNRRLETLIVTNYLSRNGKYMVDADEYDSQIHLARKVRHV